MSTLTCIESYIDKNQNHYGCFVIEPLEIGQGITLGNTLRRTILSDLTGYAISGVRINNLKHEFSIIEGLREDVLEILLNLKEIILKASSSEKIETLPLTFTGYLNVKGPRIVTAGMINLPENILSILNPHQYICTIVDNSELYIEIDIEKGKGYKLTEENRKQNLEKNFISSKNPSTLFIDAIFMPVKKVNYKIKLIHDSKGNIKESLLIELLTNGSITPKRCVYEALKILLNLFYSLFISPNFLSISKLLTKTINSLEN
jgi:DNA-directed RNA polymerase subunit alpha